MKILLLMASLTQTQAAFIGDGFEEFEIDEVLEDPAYQEQFLQFLNNTHVQSAFLKGVRFPQQRNQKLRLADEKQQTASDPELAPVLPQRLDLNLGIDLDLSNIPATDISQVRKFKHIASLIMYLQLVPILGKYVYYGCYCFTNAQYDLDAGHGNAVDEIDKACKSFHHCYSCLKYDFVRDQGQENCDGTSRSYRFRGFIDPVTKVKHIECLNEPGSCKRSICECDKKLAMDLRELEFTWNIYHHQKWGGFDKSECKIQTRKAGYEEGEVLRKCCGNYPTRYPFIAKAGDGQETACCNGQTYDPNGPLECCEDRDLVELGNCVPQQPSLGLSF